MRRIWLAAVAIVASGCSSLLGIGTFQLGDAGGGSSDGNSDVPLSDTPVTGDVGPDASPTCFGPNGWQVCVATAPTTPVTLTTPFSTDTDSSCLGTQPATWVAAGQPNACIVVGTTVIGNGITVTGSRPLVLVGADGVNVNGLLAGGNDTTNGPGAPSSHCSAFPTTPTGGAMGAGAGAGASFMSKGGDGGTGDSTSTAGTAPTADAIKPALLRGGCVGQNGANGGFLGGGAGGLGGKAGGAVYIVSGGTITIAGDLFVGGSGGRQGKSTYGGGGGAGTGGSIVLYAPTIVANNAKLSANGGGGGGGGGNGTDGNAGSTAGADTPNNPAQGGDSGFGGGKGRGGFGNFNASSATAGSPGGSGNCGGGGGGGGGGYIRANVMLNGAIVSPAPDIVP